MLRCLQAGRILDVGCGEGGFLAECSRRGFKCFGNEISEEAARKASAFGKVVADDFLKARLQSDFFDAVTLWHVLEHLPQPVAAIQSSRKLLKKGGLLFVALPNPESMQARLFKRFWAHLDAPRHHYIMPPKALGQVLAANGFTGVCLDYFMRSYNAWGFGMSVLNALGMRQSLGTKPSGVLKTVGAVIFSGIAAAESAVGMGGTYLLVARKE